MPAVVDLDPVTHVTRTGGAMAQKMNVHCTSAVEASLGGATSTGSMSSIRVAVDVDRATFYEHLRAFSDLCLYQTPAFADATAAQFRARTSCITVFRGENVIGACVLRIKTVPWLGWGIAYALHGPVWRRPGARPSDLAAVLRGIRTEYGQRRGLSIRLRPRLWRDGPETAAWEAAFVDSGFTLAPHVRVDNTLLVDLTPSLAEIRGRFQRRWRNYLSQAERAGMTLTTDTSEASFAAFLPLYEELRATKGFVGVDGETLRRAHAALPLDYRAEITLCWRAGRLIAGHIASPLGDTCLGLLAANNAEARACRAANLVWWERFQRAKAAGLHWYDLGGIDYEANRSVSEAKSRLGGARASVLGEYRCESSLLRARLLNRAEWLYRQWRRRRRSDPRDAAGADVAVSSAADEDDASA